MRRESTGWLCAGLALAAMAAPAVGKGPIPVSPGEVDGFSSAGSACPTFSWSGVEGAAGYELVVYSAPEADGGSGGKASAEVEPLIRRRLPGGALSWTPPAQSCLEPAKAYAWSVRALGEGEAGGWSESALFRIDPGAALAGLGGAVERALAVYLEERGVPFEPDGAFAATLARVLAGPPAPAAEAAPAAREEPVRYARGRALRPGEPFPRFVVLGDEVELWLDESGSTSSDFVQLVMSTPDFDGDPINGDAWNLAVVAQTGISATGRLFLSSPSGADVFQADPVGVGLDPPIFRTANLELPNIVRLIPQTAGSRPLCNAAADEGQLHYEDSGNDLCYCDGVSWKKVDGDGAC